MINKKLLLCACLVLSVTQSYAQDKFAAKAALERAAGTTPLEHYNAVISLSGFTCGMSKHLNSVLAESGGTPTDENLASADYKVCIASYKPTLKKVYDAAAAGLKKSAAKSALKEHYIQAIVGLDGIAPNSEERKFQYEARQNENKTKLAALWTRFEVEK